MVLVLGFQGFNALKSAGPAVVEGEGLGEGLAGDGDENEMFWFHIDRILKIILVNKNLLFATLKKSY